MSWKKILLLAIILSGLLIYVSKFEVADDVEKATNEKPFQDLNPQAIISIQIKNPLGEITLDNKSPAANEEKAELGTDSISESDAKSWQVQGVDGSELDRAALNAVTSGISRLNFDTPISKEEAGTDLAPFGLATPEVTAAFKTKDKNYELKLGKMNDFVAKRYIQLSGRDGLFLVSGELFGALNKKPGDFRKRTPIELIDGDIQQLTLNDLQSTIKLTQDDKNKWKIAAPIQFPAGEFAVSNITREIRNLRASEFIDGKDLKDSDYGFDKPSLKVAVDFKESTKKPQLELLVGKKEIEKDGKKEGKYYFRISGIPSVFETATDPTGRVMRPVSEIREKKLFKFATDQASEIEFSGKSIENFSIKRVGSDWKIGEKLGDKPFVDQVVRALSELEAAEFPDGTQSVDYGFGDPTLKVTVHLVDPGAEAGKINNRVLTIGKEITSDKDKSVSNYASIEGLPELFTITGDALRKISPHKEALLKSEPEPVATATALK